MGGFDHKYFIKLNEQLNMDKIIIDRPLILKKFKKVSK